MRDNFLLAKIVVRRDYARSEIRFQAWPLIREDPAPILSEMQSKMVIPVSMEFLL
jgi:hypothetical protein